MVEGVGGWTGPFEASRPRLRAVAHRMLGSQAEADDAVQDVWLRLGGTDLAAVDNPAGWLTTVTARVCLDRLRVRRSRREEPAADALGHDVAGAGDALDPERQALVAASVGAALMVVLDRLGPAERVAFVLHDVFAVPFDEIAAIVERSPDAARQLASRARRRVQGSTETAGVDLIGQRTVVDAFLRAARSGDLESLMRLLDPDVVLQPDTAALRMGALRATRGAEAVAGVLSGGARGAQLAVVGGVTGLAWAPQGQVRGLIELTVVDGRIVAIDVTGDAARLATVDVVILDT